MIPCAKGLWRTLGWLSIVLLAGGCVRPIGGASSALQAQTPLPSAVAPGTASGSAWLSPTPAMSAADSPTMTTTAVLTPTGSAATAPSPASTKNTSTAAPASAEGRPLPTAAATVTPVPTTPAIATVEPTPDGLARTLRVPILMYHYVSTPPADADAYRRGLSVTPAQFESHLRYLSDAGYHTISLDDLLYALAQGRPLPEKPVILTFDDGYADNFTEAFPLLRKYGMMGHFFILTDVVNAETAGYMTWPQIEKMAASGQHFGSHARNHSQSLSGKSVDFLVWHALGGMEAIQEHLGYHPRWIAYPSGKYDAQAIAVYKSAGYWGGLTTEPGAQHTLDGIFTLKRLRIHGSTTAERLAVLLKAKQ